MTKKTKSRHFGKILIDNNVISPDQLQDALLTQKNSSLRLGEILIKKGFATEEDILKALAEHYNIKHQMQLDFQDEKDLFSAIPVHFIKKNKIVPFKKKGKTIYYF